MAGQGSSAEEFREELLEFFGERAADDAVSLRRATCTQLGSDMLLTGAVRQDDKRR